MSDEAVLCCRISDGMCYTLDRKQNIEKRDFMSEKKKAEEGYLYNANYNSALLDERAWCKDRCHECNQLRPSDTEKRNQIYRKLFKQTGKHVSIEPPFWCDYGYNITIGDEFFMNHNGVILDGAEVIFGDYVYIAPNCGFYTAGHPLDEEQRRQGLEYAFPIHVESNVWIGAGVQVLAGVTIGEGAVIGAGSVVNRDIPPHVLAAGVPCKVIRGITEEDRKKYRVLEESGGQ